MRQHTWDRISETEDIKQETGDVRQETGQRENGSLTSYPENLALLI